jgi:hypothetical protein
MLFDQRSIGNDVETIIHLEKNVYEDLKHFS